MITVGHLARTYGQLPSHVVAHATTYDIMIDDVYSTWLDSKINPGAPSNVSQDQLQAIMNKHKERLPKRK
jgi:hypothetical protein